MVITNDKPGKIKIDGKVRTEVKYPVGFMDVVTIEETGEHFRLLYDTKGRFSIVRIEPEEARFKLCKVRKRIIGANAVPYVVTHDGRTIRYPHPSITVNDTIKFDIQTGEIVDFIKFEQGNPVMITGGRNTGRVGIITHTERHDGGFPIAHLRDVKGHLFATRMVYAFVIGKGKTNWVSLPKGAGVKKTVLAEQAERFQQLKL